MLRLTEKQFAKLGKKAGKKKRSAARRPRQSSIEWREAGFALSIPLQVVSEINQREHWARRHRRNKAQQTEVTAEWRRLVWPRRIALPCAVRCVQVGPGRLDSDNLAGAFKHVRDAVASLLGIDDGSDLIAWSYAREAGRQYSIRIELVEIFTSTSAETN